MEENFQTGPDIAYLVCPSEPAHFFDYGQKPGGHTRYVGDVFLGGGTGKGRQLFTPVLHQRYLFRRNSHHVDQCRHPVDERCAQVADSDSWFQFQLIRKTAAQYEAFAGEYAAPGIHAKVMRQHIARAGIMVLLEAVFGDRHEFRLSAACAAALRKPAAFTRPEHIALSFHHAHGKRADVVIFHSADRFGVSCHRICRLQEIAVSVAAAVFCISPLRSNHSSCER